jgi:hypothetical protein
MANPQLLQYIKERQESGASLEQIKQSLVSAGWSEVDVDEALNGTKHPVSPPIPLPPQTPAVSIGGLQSTSPQKSQAITALVIFGIVFIFFMAGAVFAYSKYGSSWFGTGLSPFLDSQEPISPLPFETSSGEGEIAPLPFSSDNTAPTPSATPVKKITAIKDCREDINCFISASATCGPAKVVDHFNLAPMQISGTQISEVSPISANLCLLTNVIIDYKVPNAPKEILEAMIGTKTVCRYEPAELQKILIDRLEGTFSMSTSDKHCEIIESSF